MKTLVLLTAALLGLTALGQTWERDATPTEDAWQKLQILAEGDAVAAADHMKSHGITLQSLDSLRDYAVRSRKQLDEFLRGEIKHICENRAKFEEDPEALAQYFEQMEIDKVAFVQGIVDRLPEVIGETDALTFQSFVQHERRSRVGGMNRGEALRSGKISAKQYVDRACSIGEGP